MPELPEVETTLRGILPHLKQQSISKVVVRHRQLRWPIPADLPQVLLNNRIENIERRAKYLLLKTNSGTLIIHLGMSGHLRLLDSEVPPKKHDHVDIVFHNKKTLRFNDPRRFGAILWTEEDPHQHALLKNLGVEALATNFTGKYLFSRTKGKKIAIKSFLMDNKIVTGIGNIYATEALFASGIHPAAPAHSISVERLNNLVKSSKHILRLAIKRGGTTLKDFMKSDGKPGYFSNQLKAYGRAGQPCIHCNSILQAMLIGQRNTVYCKHCQS